MGDQHEEVSESQQLNEDVKDAVQTLEDDDPPEAVLQILETPQGKQVIEQLLMTAISVHEERHSGPLPAPQQLHQYDQVVPGAAERIMQMAEREQAHRHELDKGMLKIRTTAVDHLKTREARGQKLGAFLAFCILLAGVYLMSLGQYGLGVTLCTSTMVAIAGVFVLRQKSRGLDKLSPSSKDDES